MPRHIGRIWLVAALLVIISAGAALAQSDGYAFTVKGNAPDWFGDPSGCVTWTRAEWTSWDTWVDNFGAAPDAFEANFTPLGPAPGWKWAGHAIYQDNVDEDGILVKGHDDEWDFGLVLGNKNLAPKKQWYLEFELDFDDDTIPAAWDPDRFSYEAIGRYTTSVKDFPFETLDSGWKVVTEDDEEHLVWWGTFEIEPQSDLDKFLWKWNTNSLGEGLDDFRVSRVTTGTCCTPEPVTMALLALGLPAGLIARRRRASA